MSPPGKEKGALQGALFHTENYDARTVARLPAQGNIIPELVARLIGAGIVHEYRRNAKEAVLTCPWCEGRLSLHVEQPWHFCFSRGHCPVDRLTFDEVIGALCRQDAEIRGGDHE